MPTESLPGRRNGFTLIELLVVLFIIGLLAGVAVLSIPSGSGALDEDAQRFAARVAALRDNAILQSRPMAVEVRETGYGFLQRRAGEWTPLNEKPFTATAWSGGVIARMDGAAERRIAFESTGLAPDAAKVVLQSGEEIRTVGITPMGEIELVGQAVQ